MSNELYHFNPNHDRLGRFAAAARGSSYSRRLANADDRRVTAEIYRDRFAERAGRQERKAAESKSKLFSEMHKRKAADYKENSAALADYAKTAKREINRIIAQASKEDFDVIAKKGKRVIQVETGSKTQIMNQRTRYIVRRKSE